MAMGMKYETVFATSEGREVGIGFSFRWLWLKRPDSKPVKFGKIPNELLQEPVWVDDKTFRLHWTGRPSCDYTFTEPMAAQKFMDDIRRGNTFVGKSGVSPDKAAREPERSPPMTKPRARTEGDDFGDLATHSNLPSASDSDRKRQHLDSFTRPAPDKRQMTSYNSHTPQRAPQRAVPVRREPIVMMSRSVVPQRSAAYTGYRSSETFGLRNLGNTCYLNAVTQALFSLREFVRCLREMPKAIPPCQDGPLYRCTTDILAQMSSASSGQGGVGGPLSPAKLRECIASAAPMFAGNGQQDAHEFLLEYVNQLHDELLEARGKWLANKDKATDEDAVHLLATQIHLDSEVQKHLACIQCGQSRDVPERFRDFSLDFCGGDNANRCSLEDMLAAYFADEVLEAKCERCGAPAAHMQKQVTAPPRILVLHLKRFVPNIQKQRYDKQHQSVDIPSSLDLHACMRRRQHHTGPATVNTAASPDKISGPVGAEAPDADAQTGKSSPSSRLPARPLATVSEDGAGSLQPRWGEGEDAVPSPAKADSCELVYDLRSVVAHDGASPHSGHYVCHALSESGAWRLYDDSLVKDMPAGHEKTLGSKAYILFYVLRSS
eukprot:gnl/TRDRNA2_/TRDRNA2_179866_c0_seq1.p1 gnl/TRDRNA2_/TRDRNA2_179866_c0~~gnl/TRDRNA2_/TRDRNA2_179866_c0_seq1.p1  ORF type:complete len:605 (+),score=80.15 gnl/TRDRNA2_/TRDRNA2_179866_c0_seq1:77-1891(+)